jgi:hypothetical protein
MVELATKMKTEEVCWWLHLESMMQIGFKKIQISK